MSLLIAYVIRCWRELIGIILALALIWYVAGWVMGESSRDLDPFMRDLSVEVCDDFARRVPRIRDVEHVMLVTETGSRHEDDRLRVMLEDRVRAQRKYTLWTYTELRDRMRDGDLWAQLMEKAGYLPGRPPRTPAEVERFCQVMQSANIPLDAVFVSDCVFDQGDAGHMGAEVSVEGTIMPRDGRSIPKFVAGRKIESRLNRVWLGYKVASLGWIVRLALALGSAFLSFAFIDVSRWVIRRDQNSVTGAWLGFLTLLQTGVLWASLWAFVMPGMLGLIFMVGVSGWCQYDALDYIRRRLL